MKNLLKAFWNDEKGFIITAEAALLATVGVLGATVGVKMAATSINEELSEVAQSFRSLDQSYCYNGHSSCSAYTAGSRYQQQPVERSLKELRNLEKKLQREQDNKNHPPQKNRSDESLESQNVKNRREKAANANPANRNAIRCSIKNQPFNAICHVPPGSFCDSKLCCLEYL